MNIEIYIPTKPQYSKVFECETLGQAAQKVLNNIYLGIEYRMSSFDNEIEYVKQAIFDVARTKSGEGVILFCSINGGAYAKLV